MAGEMDSMGLSTECCNEVVIGGMTPAQLRVLVLEGTVPEEDSMVKRPRVVFVVVVVGDGQDSVEDFGRFVGFTVNRGGRVKAVSEDGRPAVPSDSPADTMDDAMAVDDNAVGRFC